MFRRRCCESLTVNSTVVVTSFRRALPAPMPRVSQPTSSTQPSHSPTTAGGPTIFRREVAEGNVKSFPLSVDVPQKKYIDMFADYDTKRCKLCNETYMQWGSHCNGAIPHIARESLMLEMTRAFCGTPEEIMQMWWKRLHTSTKFQRIPQLSHDNSYKRKRRLLYLLTFLRDKKILRECFNVNQASPLASMGNNPGKPQEVAPITSAGRSFEFERLEWVGDNVVKYVFNNRINVLFPYSEGGIRGRLGYVQFMIDGNEGLARAYDYLEMQKLTMSDRVVSKFKSDVVETLFGELQLYLWCTQFDWGTEYVQSPFTPEMIPLRALVQHVMEEAAHCILMYHLEFILNNMMRVIKENQVNFVRADPALQNDINARKDFANSLYGAQTLNRGKPQTASGSSSRLLSPTRVPTQASSLPSASSASGGRDLYFMSTNYDAFRLVTTLGGLLPRPFAEASLNATPAFLPHIQRSPVPPSVVKKWDGDTSTLLKGADSGVMPFPPLKIPPTVEVGFVPTSVRSPRPAPTVLKDVWSLKDAGLVPELV